MNLKSYKLSKEEKLRLKNGVRAALAIPLVDSLEDFIWEGIFCYAKQLEFVDPLAGTRSKRLFDIVDTSNSIGWSAKALQWNMKNGGEFELVIQRADIFKKHVSLGFSSLSTNSDPNQLGVALLKHWQDKVLNDALRQKVIDKRICILILST